MVTLTGWANEDGNSAKVPGISGDTIIGPFFVDGNHNADKYLIMLQEETFPSPLYEDDNFPVYFQHHFILVFTYING